MNNPDLSAQAFFCYLKKLDETRGKLHCLNVLTITQGLTLPDALLIYDCFVKL